MKFSQWLKDRIKLEGFGPYIGPCIDTDNYQVQGACSNYESDKKIRQIRHGNVGHRKKKKR